MSTKALFITDASSGIGAATARLAVHTAGYGGNLSEEMKSFGGRCTVIAPGMVDTAYFDEPKHMPPAWPASPAFSKFRVETFPA